MAITITVTSSPLSVFKFSEFCLMQPLLWSFLVLQELTPSCIQQSVGRGGEVLHSASLMEVVTKQWQKPRLVCTWMGRQSVVARLQILFVLLSSESFPSFCRKYPSFGRESYFQCYFHCRNHSKSFPVVSEPRGEADKVPCHQMVYFCFLSCFCWRSAGNFICREGQDQFNTANILLEPAHNQCESSGLVHQYKLQPKSGTFQGKRNRIVSATGVEFGWRGEKWSDGFLFNSYLSHSCCPPLIFVHGPKKMWWVFCVDMVRVVMLELSNKFQWAWWEGRLDQNKWVRFYCWFLVKFVSQKGLKMTRSKLRIWVTFIEQPHSPVSRK